MSPITVDASELENGATARHVVIDARYQFARLSDGCRRPTSLVADAVDQGLLAARRAITSARRHVQKLVDLKDEADRRVIEHPLEAVSAAAGVGLVLGLAVGVLGRDPSQRQ
jgi:hypothetical protein